MTIVQSTMQALRDKGLEPEWHATGGNCYAIRVPFAGGEVLVTDIEDVYSWADLNSDDNVFGFWATAYDGEGENLTGEEDGAFYSSPSYGFDHQMDEAERVKCIRGHIDELAVAVQKFVKEQIS